MSIAHLAKKMKKGLIAGSATILCATLMFSASFPVAATETTDALADEPTVVSVTDSHKSTTSPLTSPSSTALDNSSPDVQKSSATSTLTPVTKTVPTTSTIPSELSSESSAPPQVPSNKLPVAPIPIMPIDVTGATADATAGTTYKITVKDKIKKDDVVSVDIFLLNNSTQDFPQVRLMPFELDKNENFGQFKKDKTDPDAIIFGIKAGESIQLKLPFIAKKDLSAGAYDIQLAMSAPGYQDRLVTCKVIVQRVDSPLETEPNNTDGTQSSQVPSDITDPSTTLPSGLPDQMPNDLHNLPDLNQLNVPGYDGNGVYDFGLNMSSMSGGMPGGFDVGGGSFEGVSYSGVGVSGGEATGNNKPKLIISNYKLEPSMPEAGKDFTMDLTFTNTNSKKDVHNIKITLNAEASGGSVGMGIGGQGTGGVTTSDSVFSPVGSSNTFYIEKIESKGEVSKAVTMRVIPSATAQNYTMNVLFEYEDKDGNEYRTTEIIGIPVVQQAKMETGEVVLGEAEVGVPLSLDIDFFNIGKDVLSTFMVTTEGKGFTTESPRYFIGNFTPGQSDHYNTMIIPEEAGELKGEIVFTFEDSAGNEHRETVPFDTTVVEGIVYGPDGTPMASGGDMANGQIAGNTSSSFVGSIWFWLIVIIALVGIIVVVMVIVKRNKSAKDLTLHD